MDNVDAAQLAKAQAMMTEKPTAKGAVKNYWMMVLASGLPGTKHTTQHTHHSPFNFFLHLLK